MAEDEIENSSEDNTAPEEARAAARRKFFSRRNVLGFLALTGIGLIVFSIIAIVMYRTGVVDNYIKTQLVNKFSEIGMTFEAESFRVTVSPLEAELRNATFRDKITGEKLFFIRDLKLGLTVLDLLSWRMSRDIRIDKSDITGAEVWVTFDENGRSNFSNLKFIEDERGSAVNFKYESVVFTVQDSIVHFGDLSRRIAGTANNVMVSFSPADASGPVEHRRFKFDIYSAGSNFSYDEKTVENLSLRAAGIADDFGADVTNFALSTPLGDSTLTGQIRDWADPRYEFDIQSTIDITQAVSIFSPATALRGVGNFKGRVSGQGENYHIEGVADSEAIRAGGVYLKAANVEATVEGTNSNYTANGKAVAEMLTFEDFQIDFPKLSGNVRGTGTDFQWVGELQAIAAKSPTMSLGGLFLSDAMAEYKDRQLRAEIGNGRAQKFSIGDTEFQDFRARNLKLQFPDGGVNMSAPNASAASYKSPDYRLDRVTTQNLKVNSVKGVTTVDSTNLRSESAQIDTAKLKNVSAREFRLKTESGTTGLSLTDLRAERVDANGTRIDGIETPLAIVDDTASQTIIYSDKVRVAKIDTGSAVLGSLNIAGVRLTIRSGTIEGHSDDIDAGNIALTKTADLPSGGTLESVKINRPVFILERSGRYRATADMSIGGGTVGSIALGAATAKVDINNDRALLNDLNAKVLDGDLNGTVTWALNSRSQSRIDAEFTDLDLAKLTALQSGMVIPLDGKTRGSIDLTFPGRNYKSASGTVTADITASAGEVTGNSIPINGNIVLNAVNGLFNISNALITTAKSELRATGQFDLQDNDSNLVLALNSTDAGEIQRIIEVTDISPDLERQLTDYHVMVAGNFRFTGTVTGNLFDKTRRYVEGKTTLDRLMMRDRMLGSVATDIKVDPTGVFLTNGKLNETAGGKATFDIAIPFGGQNNTEVKATLSSMDIGNLIAALPIELPERIRDLTGSTSGKVDIVGLPNLANGKVELSALKGTIAGQSFDNLIVNAVFSGTRVDIENAEMRVGDGSVSVNGNYDWRSTAFDLSLKGTAVPVPLVLAILPPNESIPVISGVVDLTATATGRAEDPATFNVNFDGAAKSVTVGETSLGEVLIYGKTANSVLTTSLKANLEGRQQVIDATVNFGQENMPFSATTVFEQSSLAPYFAFVPQLKGVPITGTGTGRIDVTGSFRHKDDQGVYVYEGRDLTGTAQFTQLALNIQDTPLSAVEPLSIRFNRREVVFDSAKFAGGGSNMTVSGTYALVNDAVNDLSVNGRVNLSLLNLANTDIFFAGNADVAIRLSGVYQAPRLSGSAATENAAVATFIGSDRLTFDRVKTRVIFTSNQAEIESASGYLGGGKFTGSGGALLNGISVQAFRFGLNGDNVTVPLPQDFLTTGDARLEITGVRQGGDLQITIGGRVYAKRSLYSKDIELSSVLGARRESSLSSGPSSVTAPKFDLVIEGRDALIVRNNIADLTASVSLTLTGDANNPSLSGRITANSGTLFYRKDRYVIQRAVLEFPPDTSIEPVINLQAETEIGGYQIFVNLNGPLNDAELLSATVRSSPALPQADVVSLITTGSLSNAEGGIPTLAQTGISTVAEVLTDSIINNPARRATDKLFGLNVFEIDPIISGQQLNPSARLTVGRQINNNLRVTYSTNLSQDQNQILALEYRVSNKLSFVAQYEQRSLSNVTRNRDNFSFEIRFRKRF